MSSRRKRRWIGRAVKRPGALRKKFARWYKLKPNQKIPRAMYVKGLKRAKRRGDTRTMRQISLAMTLGRMHRKVKRRRKAKVVRVSFRPRRRAVAANRRRARNVFGSRTYAAKKKHPYWSVSGRVFYSYRDARDYAQDRSNEDGLERTIMQKDDGWSPAFLLQRVSPARHRNPWSKDGRWIEPTEVRGPFRDKGGKLYWRVPGSTTLFRSYRTASRHALAIARKKLALWREREIKERKGFLGANE